MVDDILMHSFVFKYPLTDPRALHTAAFGLQSLSKSLGTFQSKRFIVLNWRGAVASWLVCSTPERAARVPALVGDIVLRSWARHFYSHSAYGV